jgi:hypothetical protein
MTFWWAINSIEGRLESNSGGLRFFIHSRGGFPQKFSRY